MSGNIASKRSYFTTGEFARLCGVKKQTLFHYDQVGIFSPEATGENGYRYYSYEQLETFDVISLLRDLDMPLKDIRSYLNRRSPQALLELLEQQRKEVSQKLEELEWARYYLDEKMRITRDALAARPGVTGQEQLPPEHLITSPLGRCSTEKELAAAFAKHLQFCHSLDIYSPNGSGGMVPTSAPPRGPDYFYTFIFTKISAPRQHPACLLKPGGLYAVLCHNTGYGNIHISYRRLLDYVEEQGRKAGPFFYEEALLDELSIQDPEKHLLKLSVQML
ncbi:MAG: MerR family transcriptional regulator [Bacillota bacterium]|nr:MerR family transcriptional regulator [Bacillota bacterium]